MNHTKQIITILLSIFIATNIMFSRAIAPAGSIIKPDITGENTQKDSDSPSESDNQYEYIEKDEYIDEEQIPENIEDRNKEQTEEQKLADEQKSDSKGKEQNPTQPEQDKNSEVPEAIITKFDPTGVILRAGMANQEVLRIKKFLLAKGYSPIDLNYTYDLSTVEMIRDYQSKNNLVPDGIVGRNTYNKINEDMVTNRIEIASVSFSVTGHASGQRWIMINLSSNTLYHLEGDTILTAYPVATGKATGLTPQGQFKIVNKYVNPYWGGAGRLPPVAGGAPDNPLGKRWMGLSIGNGLVIGIHGNSDELSIGRYASLGCIRMSNKDVEILYDLIAIGTDVWIGTQTTLIKYGVEFH